MTGLTLSGFSNSASFQENDVNGGPRLLLGDVTFTAPGALEGARLVISGLLAEDVISLRDQGTGPGQIGLYGADASYGGTVIATVSGGVGGTLTVTFTADATAEAVEALLENLTYANASNAPSATRDLAFSLTDRFGLQMVDPAAAAPTFTALDATRLVPGNAGFDFGAPALADFDGDGDLDMVIGTETGALRAYRNDAGSFVELLGADNPILGGPIPGVSNTNFSQPTFVDIDLDGDLDLVNGRSGQGLQTFLNDGAHFVAMAPEDDPLAGIGAGSLIPAPSFVDLDNDGDQDLVLGSYEGEIQTYRNDGAGVWTELTGADNPFAAISGDVHSGVGAAASPTFLDVDGDGDLDLLRGTFEGDFAVFANQGDGSFVPLTGAANPFDSYLINYILRPVAVDLDGDGDRDLVLGSAFEGVTAVYNLTPPPFVMTLGISAQNDAPVVYNLPALLAGVEDQPGGLDLSGLRLNDADGAAELIALTISASGGQLAARSAGGVLVLLSGGSTLLAYGTASGLQAWLADPARITFTGAADHFGQVTLSVSAHDGTEQTLGGTIRLEIAEVADLREGGAGDDALTGDAGADVLRGLGGRDRLWGLAGDDSLEGGAGADTLRGGQGADSLDGGQDSDLLDYTASAFGVLVNLRADGAGLQSASGGDASGDVIRGFESVAGGRGDDILFGDAQANLLVGNAGADLLVGGEGNDVIRGGTGSDTMEGGAGIDTLDYSTSLGPVIVLLDAAGPGQAFVNGSDAQGDVARGFENLRGSAYGDVLVGQDGANRIFGNGGDDTLGGGLGRDTLTGGAGADHFVFDAAPGLANLDRITDFTLAEDLLVLDSDYFRGLTFGALPAEALRVNNTGLAEGADDRVIYDEITGTVYFDRDGTGAAFGLRFAVITPHLALEASDIFVI